MILELAPRISLLCVLEDPRSDQVHALTIAYLRVKMCIRHQHVIKGILTRFVILGVSLVTWVGSLKVNCDIVIQLLLLLFVRKFHISVEVEQLFRFVKAFTPRWHCLYLLNSKTANLRR